MFKNTALLLLVSISASAASPSGYFVDKGMPSEVVAAHASFLGGDFNQMGVSIKRALMAYPDDAGIKKDMLELFHRAYQLAGDRAITPDFKLPREVTWATVGSRKRLKVATGEIGYRLNFSFDLIRDASIEQLRIVRYPNSLVVDRQAGVGYFDESLEDGKPVLSGSSEYTNTPNPEGLYLVDVKIKGGEATQGWFIFESNNAPDSPEVTVPVLHQVFTTSTPTFQWSDFVSSLFQGFEQRKTYAAVISAQAGVRDNTWVVNRKAGFTQATVGETGEGVTGAKLLVPGEYLLQLTYRERHYFGDLVIGRETSTHVPFTVK